MQNKLNEYVSLDNPRLLNKLQNFKNFNNYIIIHIPKTVWTYIYFNRCEKKKFVIL